ncbi:GGDEF domain-containing protein [Paraglaciecola aestuariivivens]
MDVKKLVKDYLNNGVNDKQDPESSQKVMITNLFGFIGYMTCFILGSSALLRADWVLGILLVISGFIFLSSNLILRSTSIKNPFVFASTLVIISLMLLMLYLVVTGGVEGTGPLWLYIVPPMTLFFGGMIKGSLHLGLFITVIAVVMFFPDDKLLVYSYTYEFKSRILYSFLTVSLLFAFYEYARQSSFSRMREMSEEFEKQAMHDPLSGLLNRRGMVEALQEEYDRRKRYASDLTVMMCDIDHFKKINDQYGHDKGDAIIKDFANKFKLGLRKQDSVARWGGEEYLFLLPETTGKQALLLAEKLRKEIESEEFQHKDKTFNVTVSFGIHQLTEQDSIHQAISKADKNLYAAKTQGRNLCIID